MSNASTIRRQVAGTQQLTTAPLSLAVITTTETFFSLNNNGLTLTGGGVIPLSAGVTGLYQGTGQVLWVHATVTAVGVTAGTTLVLELYQVSAAQIAAATAAAPLVPDTNTTSTGAVSPTITATSTTAISASLDAYFQLDAAGNLSGWFTSGGATSTVTGNTTTTVLTGLAGEQDLNFLISATAGVHAVGTFTLDEFSLNFV